MLVIAAVLLQRDAVKSKALTLELLFSDALSVLNDLLLLPA